MLQAVLFDYDGVIGKTFERQHNWFKYWAKENNKPFDFETVSDFQEFYNKEINKQGGVQNVYDSLGLPCDMKDPEHDVWPAYKRFKKQNPSPLYSGMPETIKNIHEMGNLSENPERNTRLRMGINTTNSWESIYKELKSNNLAQYFDCFITEEVLRKYHGAGDGDSLKKPAKVSLALALGLLGSKGQYTIHIGDTLNDLSSSQKVVRLNPQNPETLITVGASWGYEGRDKLEKGLKTADKETIHFDYIIDKPKELENIVKDKLKK